MRSHHLSHHQAYTDGVNRVLVDLRADPTTKPLTKLGLDFILSHINNLSLPLSDTQRTQLRNQGGGYVNHETLFNNLAPPILPIGGGEGEGPLNVSLLPDQRPSPSPLLTSLQSTFDSFEAFQAQFTAAAMAVFGSGWTWLIIDGRTSQLRIETTAAQDNPVMEGRGHTVLLALDLWEHAYYLDYLSRRREYIDAFWKVVNWEVVQRRFEQGRTGKEGGGEGAGKGAHSELR